MARRSHPVDARSENDHGTYEAHQLTASVGNPEGGIKSMVHSSSGDQTGTLVVRKDLNQASEGTATQTHGVSPLEGIKVNGPLKVVHDNNSCFAQLSSPSTSSISPSRFVIKIG